MGPELRLYTRCGEWSRREPSSRINAGECISGGEEEASQHLASRRTQRRAHREETATWPPCVMPERKELKFLSQLSRAGMVHTSMHPLLPRPRSLYVYIRGT